MHAQLIVLKKIFDRIESYPLELNIGLRSFKNIALWLSLYALTNKSDKPLVIQKLLRLARLSQAQFGEVQVLVEGLSSIENLQKNY